MNPFGTLRAPRELIFGFGQRHALDAIASKLGQRALLITDARLADDADLLAMVRQLEKAGLAVRLDSSTLPDVPVDSAMASAAAARLRAGSGDRRRRRFMPGHGEVRGRPAHAWRAAAGLLRRAQGPGPIMPLIAIPTTAGTGSEVTPVAVLSDTERSLKIGISSPYLIPTVSICDPDLTPSLPAGFDSDLWRGCHDPRDRGVHGDPPRPVPGIAQERVFVGKNDLSDHFALRAITLLWLGLETACREGSNSRGAGECHDGRDACRPRLRRGGHSCRPRHPVPSGRIDACPLTGPVWPA